MRALAYSRLPSRREPAPAAPRRRGLAGRLALLGLAALGVVLFGALGVWQLQRRVWKLDLIARVEARAHATPTAAPGPAEWAKVDRDGYEYRRVRLEGRFLNDRETRVQAVTELGPGYWVMTPFRADAGYLVLVNRGFTAALKGASKPVDGETRVVGLLRLSEPGGGFLRRNDPSHDRWFSRDVAAIIAARGLSGAAPYFVDAEAPGVPGGPVAGLTVLAFPNNHLIYALTWFALAGLSAAGIYIAIRDDRRGYGATGAGGGR
jgi:surfeit locus 1 family protein